MIDQSVKSAVESAVEYFIDMANAKLDANFAYPEVRYDLKGRAAGMVHVKTNNYARTVELDGWYIRLNPVLLVENLNEMISQTVPHEIAHLIDIAFHGSRLLSRSGRLSQHGRTWKATMRLLGVDPDRTHSMDTSNVQGRKHRKVKCICTGCQETVEIGIVRANKMRRGTAAYKHSKCGARIELL